MSIDIYVVTPDDVGSTIKLGLLENGKYDVDFPDGVQSFDLQGTTLRLQSNKTQHDVDLASIIPAIAADKVLKGVERRQNTIVFTTGNKDNTDDDATFEVDVADLVPVKSDGTTIAGDGTDGNALKVRISSDEGNTLTLRDDGLFVAKDNRPPLVRLVNASGTRHLGYIHGTENTLVPPLLEEPPAPPEEDVLDL